MSPFSASLARITVVSAVALAAALIFACGGDEEPDYGGDQTGDGSAGTGQTFEVTADDFSFSPDTMSAAPREPFEVVLTNNGNASHTFTIDEFDVDAEVAAGEKETISVAPTESGAFSFYCRFHQGQGMEGVISTSGAAEATDEAPAETSEADDSYYDY
jgi:plastocyanin